VSSNTKTQKSRGSQFGYLVLPDDFPQFKESPDSKVKFDILPYEVTDPKHLDRDDENGVAQVGDLWYKKPFRVHHNIGSGDQRRTIVCPSTVGKKCPICEYRAELRNKKDVDKDEITALNYSFRNLYIVVPIDNDDYKEEPHIWDIAQGNFQKLLNEEISFDDDLAVFPDLEEGSTLKVRFSSETFAKNEYAKASKIEFIEREEAYTEKVIEGLPSLDECLKILSYDELKMLFLEGDIENEPENEPEEDELKERGHHKKMQRKPKEELEEELEPKEDNNDEEEEEKEKEKKEKPYERKQEKKSSKCPHGYRYGIDWDEKDGCSKCDEWDDCGDTHDEMEKKEKEEN
jgi:outer membrane biosynthesis protein TonB